MASTRASTVTEGGAAAAQMQLENYLAGEWYMTITDPARVWFIPLLFTRTVAGWTARQFAIEGTAWTLRDIVVDAAQSPSDGQWFGRVRMVREMDGLSSYSAILDGSTLMATSFHTFGRLISVSAAQANNSAVTEELLYWYIGLK